MNDLSSIPMGYSDGDVDTNPTTSRSLMSIVEERYSRRQTMFGGVAALTTAVFSSSLLSACGSDSGGKLPNVTVGAGENGSTSAGRVVILTGTTSEGVNRSEWTQVSGPTVTLTSAGDNKVTFIAPAVAASTPLVFRFSGSGVTGNSKSAETTITVNPAMLGFQAVAKSKADRVIVPEGYTATVLYRLGDPIKAGVAAYANNGTDTNFDGRAGDHHDALYYYGLSSSGGRDDGNNSRGLLVMNHENITAQYLHPNGPSPAPRPEAEALKEMEAHGVSVVEVSASTNSAWTYNPTSPLNRRITPLTVVEMRGPARGSAQLRTAFSPDGTRGRGTINNCANGVTAWGTNLTCEENWAGYFRRPRAAGDPRRTPKEVTSLVRNGVTSGTGNYGWATVTPADASSTIYRRWDAQATGADATQDFRNEPNQFGWVVEIDPYDASKAPRKRTALGRFAHEGAWPSLFVAGRRPAFYMGDDQRRDYLYKFVSATPWAVADAQAADRLAIGDKYLDQGTLYVARFNADGSGVWLPLVFGQGPLTAANAAYPFADQADVLINARLAGDALGATPMDRPEWTAVNPQTGEMYLTLTNNNATLRPLGGTDAANPRHYNDPKGSANQFGNPNGHIIRLRETGDTSEATSFTWDIYLFGAGADLNLNNINISGLDDTNDFSSPDGLWFARETGISGKTNPLLWVQTDDGAFTDVTNNQMLAAMPGKVGDGGARTITNVGSSGTATQATIVGKAPGTNLRRFLVGPIECEITGIDSTPDGRTLFINVQHPGEDGTPSAPTSSWPSTQTDSTSKARPRSATVVITKNDGGVVGL